MCDTHTSRLHVWYTRVSCIVWHTHVSFTFVSHTRLEYCYTLMSRSHVCVLHYTRHVCVMHVNVTCVCHTCKWDVCVCHTSCETCEYHTCKLDVRASHTYTRLVCVTQYSRHVCVTHINETCVFHTNSRRGYVTHVHETCGCYTLYETCACHTWYQTCLCHTRQRDNVCHTLYKTCACHTCKR